MALPRLRFDSDPWVPDHEKCRTLEKLWVCKHVTNDHVECKMHNKKSKIRVLRMLLQYEPKHVYWPICDTQNRVVSSIQIDNCPKCNNDGNVVSWPERKKAKADRAAEEERNLERMIFCCSWCQKIPNIAAQTIDVNGGYCCWRGREEHRNRGGISDGPWHREYTFQHEAPKMPDSNRKATEPRMNRARKMLEKGEVQRRLLLITEIPKDHPNKEPLQSIARDLTEALKDFKVGPPNWQDLQWLQSKLQLATKLVQPCKKDRANFYPNTLTEDDSNDVSSPLKTGFITRTLKLGWR